MGKPGDICFSIPRSNAYTHSSISVNSFSDIKLEVYAQGAKSSIAPPQIVQNRSTKKESCPLPRTIFTPFSLHRRRERNGNASSILLLLSIGISDIILRSFPFSAAETLPSISDISDAILRRFFSASEISTQSLSYIG